MPVNIIIIVEDDFFLFFYFTWELIFSSLLIKYEKQNGE